MAGKKEKRKPTGQEKVEREDGSVEAVLEADLSLQTLENLRRERDEHYDLLLRRQAEFDNFKKRVFKEKVEERLSAQSELLRELLPIVDACEEGLRAVEKQPAQPGLEAYREGYELLGRQVKSVLEKFGVEEITGIGALFDPHLHEAVSREITSEHEDGRILHQFQKGYKIKDRLLRPAQVTVAVRPGEAD